MVDARKDFLHQYDNITQADIDTNVASDHNRLSTPAVRIETSKIVLRVLEDSSRRFTFSILIYPVSGRFVVRVFVQPSQKESLLAGLCQPIRKKL